MASKVATTVTTRLRSVPGQPQPTPPLLRLPGEVRNMIYAYVFSDLEWSTVSRAALFYTKTGDPIFRRTCWSWMRLLFGRSYPTDRREYFQYEANDYRIFALTQTCRQIRAESRLLPYKYASYEAAGFYYFNIWVMGLNTDAREAVLAAVQR